MAELTAVDGRITELLRGVGQSGNAALWGDLSRKVKALKSVSAKGEPGAIRVVLQQIDDLVAKGLSASSTWTDLAGLIDLRRRLTETERRRLKDDERAVSARHVRALVAGLVNAVKRHVSDPIALEAIANDVAQLAR